MYDVLDGQLAFYEWKERRKAEEKTRKEGEHLD